MARSDIEEWADERFIGMYGLRKGITFGCPSYYRGKKLFAFLYEDALVVKTDPMTVVEKIKKDPDTYGHFNPGDGIMKNWLCITRPESNEYEQDCAEFEKWLAAIF